MNHLCGWWWAFLWGLSLLTFAPFPLCPLSYQPFLFTLAFYKATGLALCASAAALAAPATIAKLSSPAAAALFGLGWAAAASPSAAAALAAPAHSIGLALGSLFLSFLWLSPKAFGRLQQSPCAPVYAALVAGGGLWVFYNGALSAAWSWDPVEAASLLAPGVLIGLAHVWAKAAPALIWLAGAFGAIRLFRLGAALSAHHLLFAPHLAASGSALSLFSRGGTGGPTAVATVSVVGGLTLASAAKALLRRSQEPKGLGSLCGPRPLPLAWCGLWVAAAGFLWIWLAPAAPRAAGPSGFAGLTLALLAGGRAPFVLASLSPHLSALSAVVFLTGFFFLAPGVGRAVALGAAVVALTRALRSRRTYFAAAPRASCC